MQSIIPCVLSGGLCFCPCCYYWSIHGEKTNADVAETPIAQKLKERGIQWQWIPKQSKFDMGGMLMGFGPNTPQVQAAQQGAMMQVVVPTGLAPGEAFMVQAPDGQMMQVVVPPTSKGGDTINVQTAAPQATAMAR